MPRDSGSANNRTYDPVAALVVEINISSRLCLSARVTRRREQTGRLPGGRRPAQHAAKRSGSLGTRMVAARRRARDGSRGRFKRSSPRRHRCQLDAHAQCQARPLDSHIRRLGRPGTAKPLIHRELHDLPAIGSGRNCDSSVRCTPKPAEPDCCTAATVQTAKCCVRASANNVCAVFQTSTRPATLLSHAESRSRGVRGDELLGGRTASRGRLNFLEGSSHRCVNYTVVPSRTQFQKSCFSPCAPRLRGSASICSSICSSSATEFSGSPQNSAEIRRTQSRGLSPSARELRYARHAGTRPTRMPAVSTTPI